MPPLNWTERRIHAHGVELHADANPMPSDTTSTKVVFSNPPVWDSDGFFNAAHPDRISIPQGLRGRYAARLTIRWYLGQQPFTIHDRDNGFFYTEIASNADPTGRFQDTRISVAPVVNSTKTVLQVLWDGPLAHGHFLEVNLQYDLPRPAGANIWFSLRWLGRQN
ncbi:MAG: hypothetical protein QNL88_03535 [Acidobacteriota bacterium]|nr:hypothetical protein [Acidobacteriota bacterium]